MEGDFQVLMSFEVHSIYGAKLEGSVFTHGVSVWDLV